MHATDVPLALPPLVEAMTSGGGEVCVLGISIFHD